MQKALTLIELFTTGKRGFTLIELLVVISIIALLRGGEQKGRESF